MSERLTTRSDPQRLVGTRVVGDFHAQHPLWNRLGTVVAIDADGYPLILWDRRRKPVRVHPLVLHSVRGRGGEGEA
jgi:hypothetical protein